MTLRLENQRFGRLLAVEPAVHGGAKGNVKWRCLCDCSNWCLVSSVNLKNGRTKSCGCMRKELAAKRRLVHGNSRQRGKQKATRLYVIWVNMKKRCSQPEIKSSKHYFGRGISVCKKWRSSFEAFQKWALATGYKNNLTIDRIQSSKGYFPANCQWITKEQNSKKASRLGVRTRLFNRLNPKPNEVEY